VGVVGVVGIVFCVVQTCGVRGAICPWPASLWRHGSWSNVIEFIVGICCFVLERLVLQCSAGFSRNVWIYFNIYMYIYIVCIYICFWAVCK
jgi:hypothetical protein